MPYFIGMNSEVRYFLELRCCIRVRNRLSHIYKNLSRFTGQKASPTDGSECGFHKKSYLMSGTGILRVLNNCGRYQLELICCTILNNSFRAG